MSTPISPHSIRVMRAWFGFTKHETPINLYSLLGVRLFERDPQKLQAGLQYRMGQLQNFVKSSDSEACSHAISAVNKAYAVLSQPQRQAKYNRRLIERRTHLVASEFEEVSQLLSESGEFALPTHKAPLASQKPKSAIRPARRSVPMWLRVLFFISGPICGITLALMAAPYVRSYRDKHLTSQATPEPEPAANSNSAVWPKPKVDPTRRPAATSNPGSSRPNVSPSTAQPAIGPTNPPSGIMPQLAPPSAPVEPLAPTPTRLPAPTGAKLAQAESLFSELFGDQLQAAANDPQLRKQLAFQWIQLARQTRDDPASAFVLIQHALPLTIDAGDPALLEAAAAELLDRYELDETKLKLDLLRQITETSSPECADIGLQYAYDLMEVNIQADDFSQHDQIVSATKIITAKASDPETRLIAEINLRRLEKYSEKSAAAQQARQNLAAKGPSTSANQALGEWYCFYRDEWETGIDHLSEGEDPQLKQAALQESKLQNADWQGTEATADLWWIASESRPDEWERLAMEHHAVELYQQIMPQLSGLKKAVATKRIASHQEKIPH